MLFGNEDDDLDFTPQPGSSKLANLFTDAEAAKADNSSLTYTPPRQPSNKSTDAQNSASLSLQHVAVVQAFKYENGKPNNQGKLGVAILGHHETSTYKLIVYKGKQQQVAAAAINLQFLFKAQGNNFCSFLDDERISWSVKFESEQVLLGFAKQVILAKANSLGSGLSSLSHVITQDVSIGEGEGLDIGSVAVVKYTGWVMIKHSFGKVFDTNDNSEKPLKVKLGKGKVIKGWEEGLLGCRKNARRLLVIPPSLGYGTQGFGSAVPPNSILIFDISVSKAKSTREGTRSSTPVSSSSVVEGESRESRSQSHSSTDDSIRARGASLSEQLSQSATSAESEKARLLSRMAKMGTQMLPPLGSAVRPSSESETEEEPPAMTVQPELRSDSPKPSVKPRTVQPSLPAQQSLMQPALQVNPYAGFPPQASGMPAAQQQIATFQPQAQFGGALTGYPYHQQGLMLPPQAYQTVPMATPPSATLQESQIPLLLSETRSHNSEVCLNLSKVANKVDMVLNKLETLRPEHSMTTLPSYMDSEVLLHNIQRIVQENIKLKEESGDKASKIQSLNEKICDLLQRNQRFMEESNSMLEQRSDSLQSSAAHSQARLLSLEKEKLELTEKLYQVQSQVSSLKVELGESQQKVSKLQEDLNELRSRSQEKETLHVSLESSLNESRQQKQALEDRLAKFEEQVLCLERQRADLEKELSEKSQLEDDGRKAGEQLNMLKATHEKEIEALQNKLQDLRSEKSSLKVTEVEKQMQECKAECEKKTAEIEKAAGSKVTALQEEKRLLEQELQKLEDMLSSSAEKVKNAYQDQIKKLLSENQALKSSRGLAPAGFDFEAELKKIMNTLFRVLQREFVKGETYSGESVARTILDIIRDYTTEVIKMRQHQASHLPAASGDGSHEQSKVQVIDKSNPPASGAACEASASEDNSTTVEKETTTTTEAEVSASSVPVQGEPKPEPGHVVLEGSREDSHPEVLTGEQDKTKDEERTDVGTVAQTGDTSENQPDTKHTEDQLKETPKTKPDWSWKPQPPPPPLFDDYDEDEDDWLN